MLNFLEEIQHFLVWLLSVIPEKSLNLINFLFLNPFQLTAANRPNVLCN